jgi:hypothetical protein
VNKEISRIAESQLWRKLLVIAKRVSFTDLEKFYQQRKVQAKINYNEIVQENVLRNPNRFPVEDEIITSDEEDEEEDEEDEEEEEEEEEEEDANPYYVDFYSFFLVRHWSLKDTEDFLSEYEPICETDQVEVTDYKFLGYDRYLEELEADNRWETQFCGKEMMVFQGTLNDLKNWTASSPAARKIPEFAESLIFTGTSIPMIVFECDLYREILRYGSLKLKELHLNGFEVLPGFFISQLISVLSFCSVGSSTIQNLSLGVEFCHLNDSRALDYLSQIISLCHNLTFLNIEFSDELHGEINVSEFEMKRVFKNAVDILLKSIPSTAPLAYLTLVNYYEVSIELEGTIHSLLKFQKTLHTLQLYAISFNLKELVEMSKYCNLKLLFLEEFKLVDSDRREGHIVSDNLKVVAKNISDTVEQLAFLCFDVHAAVLPNSFQRLTNLDIRIDLEEFSEAARSIFSNESLKLSLEVLFIFVSIEREEVYVNLPVQMNIRQVLSSTFQNKMPNLESFTVSFYPEPDSDDEMMLNDWIFKSDESELGYLDFFYIVQSYFPNLIVLEIPDIDFRYKAQFMNLLLNH